MPDRKIVPLTALILLIGCLAVSCGKTEETTEPDWSTSLIGRWTGQVESNSNGDRIVETTSVIFYERGVYRWEYTYAVNGVKDEAEGYIEEGDFTAAEATITLTPKQGDPKTLSYELTGRSDILLIISDDQGNVWNFTHVWFPSQSK